MTEPRTPYRVTASLDRQTVDMLLQSLEQKCAAAIRNNDGLMPPMIFVNAYDVQWLITAYREREGHG